MPFASLKQVTDPDAGPWLRIHAHSKQLQTFRCNAMSEPPAKRQRADLSSAVVRLGRNACVLTASNTYIGSLIHIVPFADLCDEAASQPRQ